MPPLMQLPAAQITNALVNFGPIDNALESNRQNALATRKLDQGDAHLDIERQKVAMSGAQHAQALSQAKMDQFGRMSQAISETKDPAMREQLVGLAQSRFPDLIAHATAKGADPNHPEFWPAMRAHASNYDPLGEKAKLAQIQNAQTNNQVHQLDLKIKQRELDAPPQQFVHFKEGETGGFVDKRAGAFTPIEGAGGDSMARRRAQLQEMKIDPNSHAGQVFLANGKLPAADPMTATDKKAVYEADDQVNTTKGTIQSLNKALEESKKAYSGFTAGARGYVGSLVGTEGGRATENLDNIVSTNAVANLKAIFGGNPTEGERKILLELAGSSKKDQTVRDDIYKRAIEAAQRRQGYYEQRAKQLRGGDFYKPEGGAAPAGSGGFSIQRID